MKRIIVRPLLLAVAMAVVSAIAVVPTAAYAQVKPVIVRFVGDFPPPPHPAGLAMQYFAERLPQVIPGSEARLYFSGALYTIPEAFEAMRQGNLEMTWMQMGKAASVDPWLMTVVGPGILTTVGAVDSLDKTDAYKMLVKRMHSQQRIKVFGTGDMSFSMGIGGKQRYAGPVNFAGKKIRSMGPVENASLQSWGASPVVMAFGEVPSALQSGVIDGLMTSIGGWLSVREQSPYFTIGGPGAFVGDYYMVSGSLRWWDKLSDAQRTALSGLIKETIKVQRELNWCVDKMTYDKYGTKDPSKPGVYHLTTDEVNVMVKAMGDRPKNYVMSKTPEAAHTWVDRFVKQGRELSKEHPAGTSWVEKVDCSKYASKIVIK